MTWPKGLIAADAYRASRRGADTLFYRLSRPCRRRRRRRGKERLQNEADYGSRRDRETNPGSLGAVLARAEPTLRTPPAWFLRMTDRIRCKPRLDL